MPSRTPIRVAKLKLRTALMQITIPARIRLNAFRVGAAEVGIRRAVVAANKKQEDMIKMLIVICRTGQEGFS